MDLTTLNQTAVFYALGWAIAHSLWQMGFLWLIYQLVFGLYKSIKPGIRYTGAVLFQTAGFIWFLLTFMSQFQSYQSIDRYLKNFPEPVSSSLKPAFYETGTAVLISADQIFVTVEKFIPFLSLSYLLILVLLFIRLINAYGYTQKLRTTGIIPADDLLGQRLREFTDKLAISRKISIFLSEKIDVPATIGFIKPVILLPVAAINHLSTEQVESVILHELAHIRRQDYLLNLLVSVMETILFFNPFSYLLSVSLKKDRELHCDDFVMAFHKDPKNYATALLSLEKMRLGSMPSFAMAATGENGLLLNRVKRILNIQSQNLRYGEKLIALFFISGLLSALAWLDPSPGEKIQVTPPAVTANITRTNHINLDKTIPTISDLVNRSKNEKSINTPSRKNLGSPDPGNAGKPGREAEAFSNPTLISPPETGKEFFHEESAPVNPSIMPVPGTNLRAFTNHFYGQLIHPENAETAMNLFPQGEWHNVFPSIPPSARHPESLTKREFLEKIFDEFRNYNFQYNNSAFSPENPLKAEQLEKLRLLFHSRKTGKFLQTDDSLENSREERRKLSAAKRNAERTRSDFRFLFNEKEMEVILPDTTFTTPESYLTPEGFYGYRRAANAPRVYNQKENEIKGRKKTVVIKETPSPQAEPYIYSIISTDESTVRNTNKKRVKINQESAISRDFSLQLTIPEITTESLPAVHPGSVKIISSKKSGTGTSENQAGVKTEKSRVYLLLIETGGEMIGIRLGNNN